MKALIIDDDDEMVITTSLILQFHWPGSRIVATPLGVRGVHLARVESPDLVILDVCLLDISGLEVLRQIRSFSTVPVVIMSGSADPETRTRALERGASGYLEKPFDVPDLLAHIETLTGTFAAPRRLAVTATGEPARAGVLALPTGVAR